MKFQRFVATVTMTAFAATALVAATSARAQTPGPAPVPIVKTPVKIIALSKDLHGEQIKVSDIIGVCSDGVNKTRDLVYRLYTKIDSWKCDEPCSRPALNGTFIATLHVKRREDKEPKRGCLRGQWIIRNAMNMIVASGTMVGTVRAGTHDVPHSDLEKPCETCDEKYHFEGYLEGTANAPAVVLPDGTALPACNGRICATFQGKGLDPDRVIMMNGAVSPDPRLDMRIEGAVIVPCKEPLPNLSHP